MSKNDKKDKDKKDDDKKSKKTANEKKDDKKGGKGKKDLKAERSSEEEDEELLQSKHKRKPEKGQGLTVILETKIHNFDVKVEVTGIFSYYDVFHKLIFLHDMYRSTSKSLDSEYKIEYFNHSWQEFLPADFEKLQDRTKMRIISRTYSVAVQLPVVPRPKQQYLGINLKAITELPTSVMTGKLSPYVALWVSSQKQHTYRTLIKQQTHEYTFNENFVIPVAYSNIQKGKITCFLEVAVFNFIPGGHSTDTKIGKAKLPLAVLERGHAKPRGVIIKLDKGGLVDMEIRWFENDQLIIAPEDTKGFRRSIGIGGVFFTPPSIVKAKNLKKPRADELEWFLNLPQIPLKDLLPGDIVILKYYDVLYEVDTECHEVFYQIVDSQKDIPVAKATCFSVSSFIITKEGGENVAINVTGGISVEPKFPNFNCLVYRCKNADYAKEAASWALEVAQKHPNIKYTSSFDDLDTAPNVENQNAMAAQEVPETMMCSEFVVGSYQCRKGNPMIDACAKHTCPMFLENHLNTHLENDFSFVGIVVQHLDEQEIAKRGKERSEKPKKKKMEKANTVNTDSPKKPKKKPSKGGRKGEGEPEPEKPEAIPAALMGPMNVHKAPIFGVSLVEAYGDGSEIPYFWASVFGFLNTLEFCQTVGILRLPGSADETNWYKRLFDEGRDVAFDCSCHDAVGLIKMYIRELPENVIPHSFDSQVPLIMGQYKEGSTELLNEIKFIIDSLPKAHYTFFKMLMSLLYNIEQQAEINKMVSDNIIRCIVPTMKCGPQIVALAFNNYPFMFGEAGTEVKSDDTPIVNSETERPEDSKTDSTAPDQTQTIPNSNARVPVGGNRGQIRGQGGRQPVVPKDPAVRARPAWMGGPQTGPKVEISEPSRVTIVDSNSEANLDASNNNDKETSERTLNVNDVDKQKQAKKKNRRSEVFFYNPVITNLVKEVEEKSDVEQQQSNESQLDRIQQQLDQAFALAEANESDESVESEIEDYDDDLSTSSSSEVYRS